MLKISNVTDVVVKTVAYISLPQDHLITDSLLDVWKTMKHNTVIYATMQTSDGAALEKVGISDLTFKNFVR